MNGTRYPAAMAALLAIGCATPQTADTGATATTATSTDRMADPRVAVARAIHDRVITLDTHVDIPNNYATAERDPGVRGTAQVDLVKMREGGLDAAFFIVYVGQGPRTPEGNQRAKDAAMNKFTAIHRMAEQMHPDRIAIAYRADDVTRIARSGKLVAAIGIENGYVIGNDLSLIKTYFDLGGRYMTLTHNGHNDIGDSNTPATPEHNGLSPFGEQVVREMNRVGMMVDVSHVGKKTMLDAVRLSRAPVIASHSSTTALANVPRNMDDEQLRALKANGGVMQTVALGGYVRIAAPQRDTALRALRAEFGVTAGRGGRGGGGGGRGGAGAAGTTGAGAPTTPPAMTVEQLPPDRRAEYDRRLAEIDAKWPAAVPNVQDFVNHIDHAVKLIGIDHVGISSDFDGGGGIAGWNDASETFNVTLELVRRGYTEEQIAKLWSGNLLRVWREVERVARQQAEQH
jgi:membrane dipeptidase